MVCVRVGWAQGDVKALEDALKDKQMELRNYSADSVAQYKWVDDKLVAEPNKAHMLGEFTTHSVKLKKDKLIFEGERATLIRDSKANRLWWAGKVPMKLEVDLAGADPAIVQPRLQEMMFFPDVQAAAAGLPVSVAEMLPFDVSGTPPPHPDSQRIFDGSHWIHIARSAPNYIAPKLVSSVEPKFTDEARNHKISGDVMVALHISETGRADELWVARPLGFGLDESATNAVRQYVFKPAQYEGRPVESEIFVVVNFQVF
jgi:TonB family protein